MIALYRTYRPKTFAEMIGQEHIVRTLRNAIKRNQVGHAYLFTGPRGTGKTTLARLVAKAVNCTERKGADPCGHCQNCLLIQDGRSMDIIEFDAATHTQVDKMREILEGVPTPPHSGRYKIYIIDEAHMLSPGAWNAFLKTLEEPPLHAIFILATTALHKVPETILSRCQRFDLSRFPVDQIIEKLERIVEQEKIEITAAALRMIALSAEGGMRDAESLLTQVASLQEGPITEDDAALILGTTSQEKLERLASLAANRDLVASLSFIRDLSSAGENFSLFSQGWLKYLRIMLLASISREAVSDDLLSFTKEQRETLTKILAALSTDDIVLLIELFQKASIDTKTASIPELPIEIALVKFITSTASNDKTTPPDKPVSERGSDIPPSKENRSKSPPPATITSPTPTRIPAPSKPLPETTKVKETNETDPLEKSMKASAFSLHDVKDRWRDIIREATKLNASLTLALTNAKPINAEGNLITLSVRFPFHKDRLADKSNQLTLAQAFDTILSTKTRVAVVVGEEEAKTDQPLVSQALAAFGGSVV